MLAYALLCEEAAFELATHNDQTKLLMSDYYYEKHCQTGFPGVSARPHPLLEHFQKVAAGRPIPAPIVLSAPAP
ncbi:MAG: hypothetical protein LRZ85_07695 [Alphaproteobacteria bacterium]|nr:hypothetical protein [Alphaproteobacteria bacterium]